MATWWQDDCACRILDTSGDGCGLTTDTDEPTHLCRHCKGHAAELDRLRRIEAAAREALAATPIFGVRPESVWQRLRAALAEGSAGT